MSSESFVFLGESGIQGHYLCVFSLDRSVFMVVLLKYSLDAVLFEDHLTVLQVQITKLVSQSGYMPE